MSRVDLATAVAMVAAAAPPPAAERVPLARALGRTLTEDVVSLADHPSADNSALDGYACRAADTRSASGTHPVRLHLVGESAAGRPFSGRVGPDEAVAIATGAPMPEGSDAIVMVERTSRDGEMVLLHAPAAQKHVRRRAEDFAAGEVRLRAGDLLDVARTGLAAAMGHPRLPVARRPRVAVLVTGSEVTPPGASLPEGGVYDANAALLGALLETLGARASVRSGIGDDAGDLEGALERVDGVDLIVTTGGASIGRHDVVRGFLEREGAVRFPGVRVRPGGPAMLGCWRDTPVLALPGNPVAAVIVGTVLLGAWCHQALGRGGASPYEQPRVARAACAIRAVPGKTALWLGATSPRDDGRNRVRPHTVQSSSMVTALLGADVLIVAPAGDPIPVGSPVGIVPFAVAPP